MKPRKSSGSRCPSVGSRRLHWQTVLDAGSNPAIYRLYNAPPRSRFDPGNAMLVEVDGAKQKIQVAPGTSTDMRAKKIRVKAGTGGATPRWKAGTSLFREDRRAGPASSWCNGVAGIASGTRT